MKILVSSKNGQGIRPNDFFWTKEGEILRFGFECARDKHDPDGTCGCGRSMVGIETSKGCTTFTIEERDMTIDDFAKVLCESKIRDGFTTTEELMQEVAKHMASYAGSFEVGMVIEKRGDVLQERHRKVFL